MFISTIIVIITVIMAIVGIQYIRYFLRFIYIMTKSITKMINAQKLETINLKGATNDDVTYLGVAFNSLSSVVANLMGIFQKFANQDIVLKAYRESQVKLEGTKKDLTIFFSDIKGFTYITEALGNDIIKLLNLHYDRAIREIITLNGVMGSIIGDALLAVFGALEDSTENKSLQAVRAAYKIHEITGMLRNRMTEIKEQVEHEKGKLSNEELKIYKAVLLEVGVGIDGGEVFYGTLGSYVRMTNTVIGDNVNAASRLEGLTRIYHVPTIVSEYVKKDIENNTKDHGLHFVELDTVMVKGKTKGQKIFWPVREIDFNKMLKSELPACELGLESYYKGEWGKAHKKFARCKLPFAEVFKKRTSENCPKNWSGIWELKTK